ncbi:magnesium transporter [Ectothiorhodospira mobilis]|uniref:Magnesium transporter MgtE n=2 Tax=Ectothiorhodospira mobilis TaxID=195064 RepID=A0A1I4RCX6_ECTMO|nr:magnesium transporter [Ectothiorhodospira mobilis]
MPVEMTEPLDFEDLRRRLGEEARAELAPLLEGLQDQDVAALAAGLAPEEGVRLIRALAPERAPDVFSYLPLEQQRGLLEILNDDERTRILARVSFDDVAALLDGLPESETAALLALLPGDRRRLVRQLLSYPRESAGRRMTPGFLAVRPGWTLGQALDHLRSEYEQSETVNVVFVTDDAGHLLGTVRLRDLLVGSPRRRVDSLLQEEVISTRVDTDQEEAAWLIRHYDLEVLPVVDARDVLVGILTVDDVMDVVTEETTEDFLRMGSVGPIAPGLKDAALGLLYRKRVGWLIILVFVNLISGAVISLFERSIEAVVALVFFLPLVIATGGNAGSQASTLLVRSLATGEVQSRDWLRLLGKELLVSGALGLTLGGTVWLAAVWLAGPQVGLAVAVAMVLVVVLGSLVGLLLPLVLTRLRLDPATASAPLVTSISDVGGILLYFAVATAILALGG